MTHLHTYGRPRRTSNGGSARRLPPDGPPPGPSRASRRDYDDDYARGERDVRDRDRDRDRDGDRYRERDRDRDRDRDYPRDRGEPGYDDYDEPPPRRGPSRYRDEAPPRRGGPDDRDDYDDRDYRDYDVSKRV